MIVERVGVDGKSSMIGEDLSDLIVHVVAMSAASEALR